MGKLSTTNLDVLLTNATFPVSAFSGVTMSFWPPGVAPDQMAPLSAPVGPRNCGSDFLCPRQLQSISAAHKINRVLMPGVNCREPGRSRSEGRSWGIRDDGV